METQLPPQQELAEHFDYLDRLRESGATNMWGASAYLMRHRRLVQQEASDVLSAWMKTFDGESSPEHRAAIARARST